MNITQKQMNKVNKIQLNIFKEFIKVCKDLNLKYYAVHGTLLGAVRYKGFFPYDDDIDVAMPRKDFDIFIKKGQKMLKKNLFIQYCTTEKDYPLVFAKLRDSETTFIQPVLDNFNINKGIYIDIFPIDYYPSNKILRKKTNLMRSLYSIRVGERFTKVERNIRQKIILLIIKIFTPNWNKVVFKLSNLYSSVIKNEYCILYGGKESERGIPYNIFGDGKELDFENIKINVPTMYEEYLKIIYNDYKDYLPSQKYMVGADLVEISADILDTKKSYKYYVKK